MNFKIEKTEILYRGKVFDLQVDEIIYNSGNKGIREIAVHPGGVVIVPVKDDGKIIMVSQFRYPLKKVTLELPAGKLNKGEEPHNCAVRELEEETGFKTNNVSNIGAVYTTPGFCNELLHLFLAKELIPGNHNREEGEKEMEVFEFTINEIEDKILNGHIRDAKTICAIHLAKKFL